MDNDRSNHRSNGRSPVADPGKAVAYLRVSTEDQRLGPDAQRAAIETWARATGTTIVAWHIDQGVSGGSDVGDRPGLVDALASLRSRRAGVLVVARRDRLARDVVVAAMVERAAARAGARVVSADGTGNGDTPADGFMRSVLDAAAAYERELIRSRTRAALKVKRERGEYTGGAAPFGYTTNTTGRLEPEPRELATVVRARALRATGAPLRAIVAALDAEGHRGRTGRPLALRQVARLLRPAPAP